MDDDCFFLPPGKYKTFLQGGSIILHIRNQAFPKYPKKLVYNIFENGNNEVDFLLAEKRQIFLEIDSIILGVCGQPCPNYPKEHVFYFFAIS